MLVRYIIYIICYQCCNYIYIAECNGTAWLQGNKAHMLQLTRSRQFLIISYAWLCACYAHSN